MFDRSTPSTGEAGRQAPKARWRSHRPTAAQRAMRESARRFPSTVNQGTRAEARSYDGQGPVIASVIPGY
jgi:hypothetical protein